MKLNRETKSGRRPRSRDVIFPEEQEFEGTSELPWVEEVNAAEISQTINRLCLDYQQAGEFLKPEKGSKVMEAMWCLGILEKAFGKPLISQHLKGLAEGVANDLARLMGEKPLRAQIAQFDRSERVMECWGFLVSAFPEGRPEVLKNIPNFDALKQAFADPEGLLREVSQPENLFRDYKFINQGLKLQAIVSLAMLFAEARIEVQDPTFSTNLAEEADRLKSELREAGTLRQYFLILGFLSLIQPDIRKKAKWSVDEWKEAKAEMRSISDSEFKALLRLRFLACSALLASPKATILENGSVSLPVAVTSNIGTKKSLPDRAVV